MTNSNSSDSLLGFVAFLFLTLLYFDTTNGRVIPSSHFASIILRLWSPPSRNLFICSVPATACCQAVVISAPRSMVFAQNDSVNQSARQTPLSSVHSLVNNVWNSSKLNTFPAWFGESSALTATKVITQCLAECKCTDSTLQPFLIHKVLRVPPLCARTPSFRSL